MKTTFPILIDMPVHQAGMATLRAIPGVVPEVIPFAEEVRAIPAAALRDKQILFCTFPPSNFNDLNAVQWIQVSSAGYSQLYGLDLAKKGIRATNGLGNFDVPIAEWNIAMMINLARDLRSMIANQDKGVWDRDRRFQREIRGSVVGIWGYGGIGRETARLAKALGLKVHVLTRRGVQPRTHTYRVTDTGDAEGKLPDRVFSLDQKSEFLRGLDYLILAMPETNVTKGMIGETELKLLPRHAFVLNPARGPLIQEAALLRALREGWIAGAALDTHYHYPMPADHPLWRMPNVIMTPHISGSGESTNYLDRIWDIFVQNVERFVAGKPLLNQLTPAQLNGE